MENLAGYALEVNIGGGDALEANIGGGDALEANIGDVRMLRGENGKSAYAYAVEGGYTGTEAEFAEKLAQDIPATLPNPNALTFTGAVTGSYDGSAAVTVGIPSGGGGNVSVAIKDMDGYKIAPTGTLLVATAGTQFVSAPIPVTAGEKLRITASAKYGNSLYALYDASGAMVDNQTAAATAEGTAVEEMSVTVHADAVTLRVAWDKAVTDTAYAVIRVGGQTAPDGPLVGVKCAVIGDSVIEAAAAPNAGLVELMAASTGAEITNLGVGGTGWMRGQEEGTAYYQRVADIPADTQRVLLYGSGNDRELTLGDPSDTGTETVCGCVNATLDAVYAHVPTAWVGIIAPAPWQHYPPYESGNAMELLAQALGEICRRRGVPYLDLYHSSGLRPWDDAFRELAYSNADGIHPNATGYGMIVPQCSAFLVGGGTAQKLAEKIPTALPNPNALTFTGAVTGSYDGSAPLSVEIPSGGGGGGGELTAVLIATIEGDGQSTMIEQSADLSKDGLYAVSVWLDSKLETNNTSNVIWFRVGSSGIYSSSFSFQQDANASNTLSRRAGAMFAIVDRKVYNIGNASYNVTGMTNMCESGSTVHANKIMVNSGSNLPIPTGITMKLFAFR